MMGIAFLGFYNNSQTWIYANEYQMATSLPLTTSVALQQIIDQKGLKPVASFENLSETKHVVVRSIKQLAGIYLIVNLITGDTYVGSAITGRMNIRFHKHLYGGSGSKLVFQAVQKYGLSNFAFLVLDTIPTVVTQSDNSTLLALENKYIRSVKPEYNLAPLAGNTFGYMHTEEDKARMKANYSAERRQMAGDLHRGNKLSPDTIELIRQAALNRDPMTKETRALVSANSAKAELFEVSWPDGKPFQSPDKQMVTSLVIRTQPSVASFIGCSERTVRRALNSQSTCKGWKIIRLGKALP
jgi:group I intron endonuclease